MKGKSTNRRDTKRKTTLQAQLHALAMGQGLCWRKKLWAKVGRKELEGLVLDPWARLRREELLQLLDQLDPWIDKLDEAVIQAAESRRPAVCLMQAGPGPCCQFLQLAWEPANLRLRTYLFR